MPAQIVANPSSWDTPHVIRRWVGPVAIIVVGFAMAYWSWGNWPDVLIDFGRELYVPWQLVEGKILYTDIAYLNGPLSPYVNALWFSLFGVSLLTLVICNIFLLTLLVWLLFGLFCRIASRAAATGACLAFVLVFAFGQLISVGNYNYVCPYAHELTHGLLLSTASIACLSSYQRGRRLRWVVGAGLLLGLTFLTKMEVFAAAALALMTGLGLTVWVERPGRRRSTRLLATFAVSTVIPPVIAFGLLCLAMPTGQALRATTGSWFSMLSDGLISLEFYRTGMGLADPTASVLRALSWTGGYVILFLPVGILSLALSRLRAYRLVIAMIVSLTVGGLLWWNVHNIEWRRLALPWPFFVGAICGVSFLRILRRPRDRDTRSRLILTCMVGIFALALLGKMLLNTRVYHYGFALAMPATLLVVIALIDWIPACMARLGGSAAIFRGAGIAALLVAVFVHVHRSGELFKAKVHAVSRGPDAFWADARGKAVNAMLDVIDERVAPGATLAVFPEGVMLNYLSRRTNPTPYINFMPPELIIFGEARIIAALNARRPDYVVIAHKDTSEYGSRFFGQGYGRDLFAWVQENYEPINLIGAPPLKSDRFGILLLEASSR